MLKKGLLASLGLTITTEGALEPSLPPTLIVPPPGPSSVKGLISSRGLDVITNDSRSGGLSDCDGGAWVTMMDSGSGDVMEVIDVTESRGGAVTGWAMGCINVTNEGTAAVEGVTTPVPPEPEGVYFILEIHIHWDPKGKRVRKSIFW